jgi:hypothetical protein
MIEVLESVNTSIALVKEKWALRRNSGKHPNIADSVR